MHPASLWRRALVGAAVALVAFGVGMVWLASQPPVVRSLAVHVAGWPTGARSLRLVLLSDVHVSSPGDSPSRLRSTVQLVNRLRPDLVLLAGDYVAEGIMGARSYPAATSIAPLAQLRAPLGRYAVLGNHDYPEEAGVRAALAAAGIELLDNRAVRVGPLAIVGVGDEFSHHARVYRATASWQQIGGLPVVLTHSPDVIPRLPSSMQLALAGHTHCGQVSLPLIGPPITQSQYGQRYACGIVREGDRTSVVTAGLGTSSWPIRLMATPDVWLITIGP